MTALIALEAWLNATVEAASEFASTTLDAAFQSADVSSELPPDLTGCFVALVGEEGSFQIGLASDAEGCQTLAKALFASDEDLPDEDISDALGEIANIVAGGVKKRMATAQQPLSLGLPIVMEGHLRLTERQRVAQLDGKLGQVPVRLLIVSHKEAPFNPRRTL
jgi:chemotaxis protein CheX